MKGLDTLIRLHRQHLDVKRVYRTTIETHRVELEQRCHIIRQEMKDERKTAAESLEARLTLSAYAERMTELLRALAAEMIDIDVEIARLNGEIAEAFQALKSYELTRDARERRASQAQTKRDRNELDEIGAAQHRRQAAL